MFTTAKNDFDFYCSIVIAVDATLFYGFLLKMCFNLFASIKKTEKVPLDIWMKIEVFSSILSVSLMLYMQLVTVEKLMTEEFKQYLNVAVVVVAMVMMARFYCFVLVINSLSKLLLTLIDMIIDALPFIILIIIYQIIAS